MCGILCLIEYLSSFDDTKRELFMKLFSQIKNRGPEAETLIEKDFDFFKILMGFHRLKINDTSDLGNQPFMTDYDGTITQYFTGSMTNGEIYNHLELEKKHRLKTFSKSDCECILFLNLSLFLYYPPRDPSKRFKKFIIRFSLLFIPFFGNYLF
jgi:asparagine synthetase B (glutamine-hydrolysing)